jgi:5-methylcytosine-specific restriction endonuclease McrBC GTP-binding regulatory subunit McrB
MEMINADKFVIDDMNTVDDHIAHIDTEHISFDAEKGFQECRMIIYDTINEEYWACDYTVLGHNGTDILEQKFYRVKPVEIKQTVYTKI